MSGTSDSEFEEFNSSGSSSSDYEDVEDFEEDFEEEVEQERVGELHAETILRRFRLGIGMGMGNPEMSYENMNKAQLEQLRRFGGLNLPHMYDSFRDMHNLRYLSAQIGQISRIEHISHMRHLQTLILTRNRISELTNDSFNGLENLRTLVLDKNPLESLPLHCFRPLKKLERVSFIGAPLYDMDAVICALSSVPSDTLMEARFQIQTAFTPSSIKTRCGLRFGLNPEYSGDVVDDVDRQLAHLLSDEFVNGDCDSDSDASVGEGKLPRGMTSDFLMWIDNSIESDVMICVGSEEGVELANDLSPAAAAADDDDEEQHDADPLNVEGFHDSVIRASWHPPMCGEPHYRAKMIAKLPNLAILDNVLVTARQRKFARIIFDRFFEEYAHGRQRNGRAKIKVFHTLVEREIGARKSLHLCPPSMLWPSASVSTNENTNDAVTPATDGDVSISIASRLAMQRSIEAERIGAVGVYPKITEVLPERLSTPRQFEYHRYESDLMVVGALDGSVSIVRPEVGGVVSSVKIAKPFTAPADAPLVDYEGNPYRGSVLGLCWLHQPRNRMKFVAGSDLGAVLMYDCQRMEEGRQSLVYQYPDFPKLTSLHVSCDDTTMIASGYGSEVSLYDTTNGKLIAESNSIHERHINVLKWANHHPNLYCTSSFDRTVKVWDSRLSLNIPVCTCKTKAGNVMCAWSDDDSMLVSSGVDNELRLWTPDGRQILRFDANMTHSDSNYTRAYFMTNDYVVVGSCNEALLRVFNARNGRLFRAVDIGRGNWGRESYVQSLRPEFSNPFAIAALVVSISDDYIRRSKILRISLMEEQEQE